MLRGFLVITGALAVADGILRRTLSPIPPGTLSPIPPSRRRSLRVPRMDEDSDSLLSTLPGPVSSSAMDEATAEDLLTLPGLGSAAGQPRGDIPARRLAGSGGPTVWSEFGELAAETGAVNLGQGFPDWAPPDFVVAEGVRALLVDKDRSPAWAYPDLASVPADVVDSFFTAPAAMPELGLPE